MGDGKPNRHLPSSVSPKLGSEKGDPGKRPPLADANKSLGNVFQCCFRRIPLFGRTPFLDGSPLGAVGVVASPTRSAAGAGRAGGRRTMGAGGRRSARSAPPASRDRAPITTGGSKAQGSNCNHNDDSDSFAVPIPVGITITVATTPSPRAPPARGPATRPASGPRCAS